MLASRTARNAGVAIIYPLRTASVDNVTLPARVMRLSRSFCLRICCGFYMFYTDESVFIRLCGGESSLLVYSRDRDYT